MKRAISVFVLCVLGSAGCGDSDQATADAALEPGSSASAQGAAPSEPAAQPVASADDRRGVDDLHSQAESLRKGAGVAQDFARAIELYEQAADQGHALSMYRLGNLHASGLGVEQDYETSAQWLEKAAAHGHYESAFALGLYYQKGIAFDIDEVEAYKWHRIASGHESLAGAEVGELGQTMLLAEIAEGEVRARSWMEQFAPERFAKLSKQTYALDFERVFAKGDRFNLEAEIESFVVASVEGESERLDRRDTYRIRSDAIVAAASDTGRILFLHHTIRSSERERDGVAEVVWEPGTEIKMWWHQTDDSDGRIMVQGTQGRLGEDYAGVAEALMCRLEFYSNTSSTQELFGAPDTVSIGQVWTASAATRKLALDALSPDDESFDPRATLEYVHDVDGDEVAGVSLVGIGVPPDELTVPGLTPQTKETHVEIHQQFPVDFSSLSYRRDTAVSASVGGEVDGRSWELMAGFEARVKVSVMTAAEVVSAARAAAEPTPFDVTKFLHQIDGAALAEIQGWLSRMETDRSVPEAREHTAGLFGAWLAQDFERAKFGRKERVSGTELECYVFTPPEPTKAFDHYAVFVNPRSRLVYMIMGVHVADALDDANARFAAYCESSSRELGPGLATENGHVWMKNSRALVNKSPVEVDGSIVHMAYVIDFSVDASRRVVGQSGVAPRPRRR